MSQFIKHESGSNIKSCHLGKKAGDKATTRKHAQLLGLLACGFSQTAWAQSVTGCVLATPSTNSVYRVSSSAVNAYTQIPLGATPHFAPNIASGLPAGTTSLAIDPTDPSRVYYIRGTAPDLGKLKYWILASQTEGDPGFATVLPSAARDSLATSKTGGFFSYADSTGTIYNLSSATSVNALALVNAASAPSSAITDYKVNDIIIDGWGVMWMIGLHPRTGAATSANLLRVNTSTGRSSYEGTLAFQDSAGASVAFPSLSSSSGLALSPTSTNGTPVFVWTSASEGTWVVDVLAKVARKTGPNTASGGDLASCIYTEVTVPVSFAAVAVQRGGGQLNVDFTSAQEAGAVGYRVVTRSAGDAPMATHSGFVSARGAGEHYALSAPDFGAADVFIEELDAYGQITAHGPFQVERTVGDAFPAAPRDWASVRAQRERSAPAAAPSDWQAAIAVQTDAWTHIPNALLRESGVGDSSTAGVFLGTQEQPVVRTAQGISFFAARAQTSRYSQTSHYRLGRTGLARVAATRQNAEQDAPPLDMAASVQTARARLRIAANRQYSFSAPVGEPWFAGQAQRNQTVLTPFVESFDVPGLRNSELSAISVTYWGALDFPQAPDHSLALYLNGELLGQDQFDGFQTRTLSFNVRAGQLKEYGNQLELRPLAGLATAFDRINLQAIALEFDQALAFNLAAAPNVQLLSAPQSGTYRVENAPPDTLVLNVESPSRWQPIRTERKNATLYFYAKRGTQLRLVSDSSAVVVSQLTALPPILDPLGFAQNSPADAAAPRDVVRQTPAYDQLIISHQSLLPSLQRFVAARTREGAKLLVLDVATLYAYYSADVVSERAIKLAIQDAAKRFGIKSVLLVGGDSTRALVAPETSLLPTPYGAVHSAVRHAPIDADYGDLNNDGVLQLGVDIPVGRWPAFTPDELHIMINKRLQPRASTAHGLVISDREQAGFSFSDAALDLSQELGAADVSVQHLALDNASSISTLREQLRAAMRQGGLVQYLGHSAPAVWSREAILTANGVRTGSLNPDNAPSVLLQWGCWGGYFVDAEQDTLAAAMLATAGGSRAIIAPAALTDVGRDLKRSQGLIHAPAQRQTLGQVLMQLNATEARANSQRDKNAPTFDRPAFNLLGDPADTVF
jgi:hypothetical protein